VHDVITISYSVKLLGACHIDTQKLNWVSDSDISCHYIKSGNSLLPQLIRSQNKLSINSHPETKFFTWMIPVTKYLILSLLEVMHGSCKLFQAQTLWLFSQVGHLIQMRSLEKGQSQTCEPDSCISKNLDSAENQRNETHVNWWWPPDDEQRKRNEHT
jgi:hypothetical protein